MVSVILPAYNSGHYIAESIESVLCQSMPELELIVINDGSTDTTADIVQSYTDNRIIYIRQENLGVSAARNAGLLRMRGDFFCFLDADDLMLPNSLQVRLAVFLSHPELAFVGGAQEQRDASLKQVLKMQYPNYWGMPLTGLIGLDPGCFINCGTWLIRKKPGRDYRFPVGWTHAEDLAFFFSIAEDGPLGFTRDVAQIYRRSSLTAMTNLEGLEEGYLKYYELVKDSGKASRGALNHLRRKIARIMTMSYLARGKVAKGFHAGLRMLLEEY